MKLRELLKQYNEKKDLFKRLKIAGEQTLNRELNKYRLKVERVHGRIKTFDQFRTKALNEKMSDPFKEMSDIVGLRVICLFQSDIDEVKDIIRQTFEVVEEDDKLIKTPIDVFNYKEPHFDVRLRCISDDKLMPDFKAKLIELSGMVFEIQLRTICQHAWIAISHNLFYKKENNIAKNIERDFYAINGLFYVADTHFEMIKENNKPGINAGIKHILP